MNNGSSATGPDMSEMLNRILSDPQAMNSVMKLAGDLMSGGANINNDGNANDSTGNVNANDGGGDIPRPPADDNGDGAVNVPNGGQSAPSSPPNGLGGMKLPKLLAYDSNRVKLLEALKPYLGDGRRDKISYLLNIMQILRLLEGGIG